MIKRILVPVDFSEPSRRALDYAVELGRGVGAELTVLHVVEPVYYPMAGDTSGIIYDASLLYEEVERGAKEQLSRIAGALRRRHVPVNPVIRTGAAHRVIADTAKRVKSDLIVMATHGRTGLSHVLMGSVAERVVRTAPCPVLTVRQPGGRPRRTRTAPRPARRAPSSARRRRS